MLKLENLTLIAFQLIKKERNTYSNEATFKHYINILGWGDETKTMLILLIGGPELAKT